MSPTFTDSELKVKFPQLFFRCIRSIKNSYTMIGKQTEYSIMLSIYWIHISVRPLQKVSTIVDRNLYKYPTTTYNKLLLLIVAEKNNAERRLKK